MSFSGFIGKIVRFFSKDKSGEKKVSPMYTAYKRNDTIPPIRKVKRTNFRFNNIELPSIKPIEANFDTTFSQDLSSDITERNIPCDRSSVIMPASLCPVTPEPFQVREKQVLTDSIKEYSLYIPDKAPITIVGISQEKKRQQELLSAHFNQQLDEIAVLVKHNKFTAATKLNEQLLLSISDNKIFEEFRTRAKSNVSYIAQAEATFKREEAKRLQREEEERKRRELERARSEKRQYLLGLIGELKSITIDHNWNKGSDLHQYLLSEISAFGDSDLHYQFKEVFAFYEAELDKYRADELRKELERERIRKEKEALIAEARRRRELQEVQTNIERFKSSIQNKKWSDCSILYNAIKSALSRVDSSELALNFSHLNELYRKSLDDYERKLKLEREEAERRRGLEEKRRREELAEKEKQFEKERVREVLRKYSTVQLNNGGTCIYLHKYYSKSGHGENISYAASDFREKIYAFKDKFNNKSTRQIRNARIFFCNQLTDLLKDLYADKISDVYFCTAQASTPESASRRYEEFCQMVSNASGINNGYNLIQVTGSKASASYGGGVRGDISNLTISNDVYGKRIVLLDDIITSGSTMCAIRNQLLKKGAVSVDCVAFGKTV